MNKITTRQVNTLSVIRHDLEAKVSPTELELAVKNFMEVKEAFEAELKATWKALESHMIENDIKNILNLTIAEKKIWKATGQLPPRFYKKVLDTSELSHLLKKGSKLPKGVSFTTKQYLTKTNRKVEQVA